MLSKMYLDLMNFFLIGAMQVCIESSQHYGVNYNENVDILYKLSCMRNDGYLSRVSRYSFVKYNFEEYTLRPKIFLPNNFFENIVTENNFFLCF